jgi:hypothetical protein
MKGWISQILIGIIVTVVGTVLANAIVRGGHGRHSITGVHFTGPLKAGR